LGVAPKSLRHVKDRIRQITRRNLPISFDERINRLNSSLSGWVVYFQLADCRSHLTKLDKWVRRKLRCVRLKQCKRAKAIAQFLQECGAGESASWQLAASGKGWWRLSDTSQAHQAMSRIWFEQQELVSLIDRYTLLQTKGNRRGTEQVCQVV
jgi:RNA-directed DNA polymerase